MSKGEQTQQRIVERALQLATRDGLGGVTIGRLAADLGLSKSGLYAHFLSKEELQLHLLQAAARRFEEKVVRPALAQPRGEPRVRSLFTHWLGWVDDPAWPGGCIFVAAAVELDDQPGPPRDYLLRVHETMLARVAREIRRTVEAGHFRPDLDPRQFVFDFFAIVLGYHHASRFLRDEGARQRAERAFERLMQAARA
jgi:AcrR family transcriptional regulator